MVLNLLLDYVNKNWEIEEGAEGIALDIASIPDDDIGILVHFIRDNLDHKLYS